MRNLKNELFQLIYSAVTLAYPRIRQR